MTQTTLSEKPNALISKASGKPFPLIIYDIAGEERLDQGSISFYNIEEANAIVKIIQDLNLKIPNNKNFNNKVGY